MRADEWDSSRHVVDHLDIHASHLAETVRFYETVLAPLGIPRLEASGDGACFTRLNVLSGTPATTGLHLCFPAGSRQEVDAFHLAGIEAGFRSNGVPGYRDDAAGYYAAYLLDPDGNNIEALYRDIGNPGRVPEDPVAAARGALEGRLSSAGLREQARRDEATAEARPR